MGVDQLFSFSPASVVLSLLGHEAPNLGRRIAGSWGQVIVLFFALRGPIMPASRQAQSGLRLKAMGSKHDGGEGEAADQ